MSRRRIPGCCFRHLCPPARSPRRPGQYHADGSLADVYPTQHLINSHTPGYTGTHHFPANEVHLTGNRQLSTEDAESALLEAAKAGAHEAVDSSTLEDSSLPALLTEI